ncbi:MATE family efflux transporter [Chitinivibrio alkaliphilus]|uniref:MATE efflux family protein n=1 Tax=Chitinivibrio alkaliphilus ACht1 TaxID=1313304 RepID=U7DAG4_9BACT|nr:MATE family efflux transporter [Chitinivibrio alkaliphilus]ERP39389.1 MATE efflux family protein [Chitinivibrio alkaliphilus ACht1]
MTLATLFDPAFFKRILPVALPLALRHFLISSLSLIDTVMISNVSETSIAAVDLANQITFLFIVTMIGITGGASIYTSQYWGNKDHRGIKRTLGLTLMVALVFGGATSLFAFFFPEQILSFYTDTPAIISEGSLYLQIVAFSYVLSGISLSYGAALQSIRRPKLPVLISVVALSLNTLLNYIFIFGNFGAPEMGIAGAAMATLLSRIVEVLLLVYIAYRLKTPVAATVKELTAFTGEYVTRVFKTSLPIVINQFMWAGGTSIYKRYYAQLGRDAITAVSISEKTISMFIIIFFGTATAASVIIGNSIGENNMEQAKQDGHRILILAPMAGIIVALLFYAISPVVPTIFSVTGEMRDTTLVVLSVFAVTLPFKMYNMHLVDGVLRSGGDTKVGMLLDVCGVWLIGIPVAHISTTYFNFPIEVVYLLIASEELIKAVVGTMRIASGKWIRRLISDNEKYE